MIYAFTKPSLSAIRVRFMQEKLRAYSKSNKFSLRVAATGRTGGGKSTLGNRLVGIEYFLQSSGHMDCTDRAYIVQFPAGLEYVDLPGVSSYENYENYNRVALGLSQVEDWPRAETLAVVTYDTHQKAAERTYPVAQVPRNLLQPDLIFYLVAPHQQLLRTDLAYMKEVLKKYGNERVVYVFNLFTHKSVESATVTTQQNISDAKTKIAQAHMEMGLDPTQCKIVECNCWTGLGITDLIGGARARLDKKRGEFLADVLRYQQDQAPSIYAFEVKKELLAFFTKVAFEKFASGVQGQNPLDEDLQQLLQFMIKVLEEDLVIPKQAQQSFTALAGQIVASLKRETTEPIIQNRSKAIYTNEPVYKTITETDYDNPRFREEPVYEWQYVYDDPTDIFEVGESFLRALGGGTFGVRKHKKVLTGYRSVLADYGTKTRSVIDRYEKKYSHTDYWNEHVGNRVVDTYYEPFGLIGISLLIATTYAIITSLDKKSVPAILETKYQDVRGKMQTLLSNCNELGESEVRRILEENSSIIFDTSFDAHFLQRFGSVDLNTGNSNTL